MIGTRFGTVRNSLVSQSVCGALISPPAGTLLYRPTMFTHGVSILGQVLPVVIARHREDRRRVQLIRLAELRVVLRDLPVEIHAVPADVQERRTTGGTGAGGQVGLHPRRHNSCGTA